MRSLKYKYFNLYLISVIGNDNHNKTMHLYGSLNWKEQHYSNDSLTVLAYLAVIIGIVAPHIPQID